MDELRHCSLSFLFSLLFVYLPALFLFFIFVLDRKEQEVNHAVSIAEGSFGEAAESLLSPHLDHLPLPLLLLLSLLKIFF